MKEEILLVKIHNALKDGNNYYEATRGNWRVNKMRLGHIQYVVGISCGKIVCAFTPYGWNVIKEGTKAERKYFDGIEVSKEILSKLQNSEDILIGKFGARQSIAYASLSEVGWL